MMNERLKELYLQAHSTRHYDGDPMREGNPPTVYWQGEVSAQRFAELIVRECASICELNGQSYTHSFTPAKARLAESTSNHCGLMIKRHFGVEE